MATKRLGPLRLGGRDFSKKELKLIGQIVELYPCLSRTELAHTICENISWQAPNGNDKHISCLKALQRLETQGYLKLPQACSVKRGVKRQIPITTQSDPEDNIQGRVDQWGAIRILKVERGDLHIWNEYVQRYHYLGYRSPFGLHQRYFIVSEHDHLLGCILYTGAAWALECRDKWIGWSPEQKERNLSRIINNSRFLLFPWVRLQNLASHVLSLAAKQVQGDWQERFGYKPALIETFVDPARFKGSCYRAAGWIHIGRTKGRGRNDQHTKRLSAVKDVYMYILDAGFRAELAL